MGAERCAALASHVCQALTSQPHSGLWQELFAWTGNEQVNDVHVCVCVVMCK